MENSFSQTQTSMDNIFFVRIAIVVIFVNVVTTGCAAESCPSPPVVYASQGTNITLCWKLLPEANASALNRITVIALFRPVDMEMKKVASAHNDGSFFRVYDGNHNGLYKDRATLEADLPTKILFLRMANYTSKMENVYCVWYEMSGSNHVRNCHSQAVLLRDVGNKYRTKNPSTVSMTTRANTTVNTTMTTVTSTAAITTMKKPATQGERVSTQFNYKVALITIGCLLVVLSVLAVVVFVLYCRTRKKSRSASEPSQTELAEQKQFLPNGFERTLPSCVRTV